MRFLFQPYRSQPEWYERGRTDSSASLLAACSLLLADDAAAAPFAAALGTIDPPRTLPGRAGGDPPRAALVGRLPRRRARPGRSSARCGALQALRPALTFTQNPNYVAAPPSPAFLERYGYAVLAGPPSGPPALVAHPGLAFGVLLLGPETTYPTHVHPAAELYLPLGRARWSAGGRPLVERPAGTPIVHVPDEPHATQTAETPLAALYVWLGELGTAAQIL